MDLVAERPAQAVVPAKPDPAPKGAMGYLGGVLLFQIVNNALHLAQPLMVIKLAGGSMAAAAWVASSETAIHMCGTLIGGWPTDKLGARRTLVLSVLGRALSLGLVPLAWMMGELTLQVALVSYTLDAIIRGLYDTAVHAAPLELSVDQGVLDDLNSKYEIAFDFGGLVGPILLGAAFFTLESIKAWVAICAGFAIAALCFAFLPKPAIRVRPAREEKKEKAGSIDGAKAVLADHRLIVGCGALAILNLYPLRKLLSVFFAKGILHSAAATPWIGAAYGLGGTLGGLVYSRWGRELSPAFWVCAGGVGVLGIALGWIPGTIGMVTAGSFLFAVTNAGARLVITRVVQQATPEDLKGGVTAVARGMSNIASVVLKAAVGAAFAMGASAVGAFSIVGAGLGVICLLQLALALKLKRENAAHV